MLNFIIIMNVVLIVFKGLLKFIDSKIIIRAEKLRFISIIGEITIIFACIFFYLDFFSISLIKLDSFFDVFFLFFCYHFLMGVAGLFNFLIKKVCRIDDINLSSDRFFLSQEFSDFVFLLLCFYLVKTHYVEKDFLVLLSFVLIFGIQTILNMWMLNKFSLQNMMWFLLVIFYTLFIFVGTNNILLSAIFFVFSNLANSRSVSVRKFT